MAVVYTNGFTSLADFTTDEITGSGGTRDIVSNQYRNVTTVTDGNCQRTILGTGSFNGAEVKATIFFTTQAATNSMSPQFHVRGSNDWAGGDTTSPTTCYKLIWVAGNIQMYRRSGGSTVQLGSNVALALATTTTYGMTIQATSNQISGRIWNASGAEPGTWDIGPITDNNVAGPGTVQFCLFGQAAIRDVRWDNLSIDDLTVAAGTPTVRPGRRVFA